MGDPGRDAGTRCPTERLMDLRTLWYLTLGTLLVAAAMTLWERKAATMRSRELGFWAAGLFTLATGCLVAMVRGYFPSNLGSALSNLLMLLGYLLVLQGVVTLDRRYRPMWTIMTVAAAAAVWGLGGTAMTDTFWHYVGAFPIAVISGATAYALFHSRAVGHARSKNLAVAVFAFHGTFYLARAIIMPVVVANFGPELLPFFAKTTMLEGALYAVAMPMALIALVREEYQESLIETTRTDHLTGLTNRRGFFERGEAAIKRALTQSQVVSLLAFDLDHFKSINDQYGHSVGDTVLTLFANTATEFAGPDSLLARLGGEEFALLLVDKSSEQARVVGEAISRTFAERSNCLDGMAIGATVSVGVAESKSTTTDLAFILGAADRALYRAKSLGRNRIELAKTIGMSVAA